jgi:hypothetical protein
MRFLPSQVDAGDGERLIVAMRAEMAELYPGLVLDGEQMPKAGPTELSPPGGAFVVGYEGAVAVCCGGVKRLDRAACEIKRIYESEGYAPIGNFNANPVATFFGEKPL